MAAETPNLGLELRRLNLLEWQRQGVLASITSGLEEAMLDRLINIEVCQSTWAGQLDILDKREAKISLTATAVPALVVVGEGVGPKEIYKISLTREMIPTIYLGPCEAIMAVCGDSKPDEVFLRDNENGWQIHGRGVEWSWHGWLQPVEKLRGTKEGRTDFLGLALVKEAENKIRIVAFPVHIENKLRVGVFDNQGWLITSQSIGAQKQELITQMTPLEVWQEDRKMFFKNLWDFLHDPKKTDGREEMRRVNLGIAGVSGEVHLLPGSILLKVYGVSRFTFKQNGGVEQARKVNDRQNLEIVLLRTGDSERETALICSTINIREPQKRRYLQTLNQEQINRLINLFGQLRPY